jgi:S1-C subfamily serine protease
MNRSRFWSLFVTALVIFSAGLVAGMWLIKRPVPQEQPQFKTLDSSEAVVMRVYKEISPAVVNIVAESLAMNFWMQVVPQFGQGSGFVIDNQGHIITNNHVVANAENLEVTFKGGQKVQAKLVGRDPLGDLAVIKVDPFPGMEVAPLGDSDHLQVGQRVIAIGNPFGLQQTVTAGFISALNRDIVIGQRTMMGMIQTDTAINQGNSGGPLINAEGKVIGINTALVSQTGGFAGISVALPINRAQKAARQIIALGRPIYPWIGIKSWMDLNQQTARTMGLPAVSGVLIFEIAPGSPAAHAGLRGGTRLALAGNRVLVYNGRPVLLGGDVILEVDGVPTPTYDDYRNTLIKKDIGSTARLKILRGHQEFFVTVPLVEAPGMASL